MFISVLNCTHQLHWLCSAACLARMSHLQRAGRATVQHGQLQHGAAHVPVSAGAYGVPLHPGAAGSMHGVAAGSEIGSPRPRMLGVAAHDAVLASHIPPELRGPVQSQPHYYVPRSGAVPSPSYYVPTPDGEYVRECATTLGLHGTMDVCRSWWL